jgi:hypothetical protein
MIDDNLSEQLKSTIDRLFEKVFDKYKYNFFDMIKGSNYLHIKYKSESNKMLIFEVELLEKTVDITIAELDKHDNGSYLVTAMKKKGANTNSVRDNIEKNRIKSSGDWVQDEIEKELPFINKFGDLVL